MAVAKILTHPHEFASALNRSRGSVARIGHNTTVEDTGQVYRVRYHGNIIAQYGNYRGRVALFNGGHSSYTTAGRLNQITTAHNAGWVSYSAARYELIFTSKHTGRQYFIGSGAPLMFFDGGEVDKHCQPLLWPAHEKVLESLQDSPELSEELKNSTDWDEFCSIFKANKKALGYRRLTQLNLRELYHDITGRKPWN